MQCDDERAPVGDALLARGQLLLEEERPQHAVDALAQVPPPQRRDARVNMCGTQAMRIFAASNNDGDELRQALLALADAHASLDEFATGGCNESGRSQSPHALRGTTATTNFELVSALTTRKHGPESAEMAGAIVVGARARCTYSQWRVAAYHEACARMLERQGAHGAALAQFADAMSALKSQCDVRHPLLAVRERKQSVVFLLVCHSDVIQSNSLSSFVSLSFVSSVRSVTKLWRIVAKNRWNES